jgi:hypothetical protein
MPKPNVKVIKVPLTSEEKLESMKPQVFPRMPILYLELLENKKKIKPDLIGKDYNPQGSNNNDLDGGYDDNNNNNDLKKYQEPQQQSPTTNYDRFNLMKSSSDPPSQPTSQPPSPPPAPSKYNEDYDDNVRRYDNDSSSTKNYRKDYYSNDDNNSNAYNNSNSYNNKREKPQEEDPLERFIKQNQNSEPQPLSPSSNLSDRLKELLKEEATPAASPAIDKYSRARNNNDNYRSVENYRSTEKKLPPLLSELESKGNFYKPNDIREIRPPTKMEQEEEDMKRELMFKIDLLKKSYPNAIIPEFSIHSEYNTIKKTYDATVKRLSLDSTVETYKTYLIGAFMGCEFILGNYLGFDMEGFTQQQIMTMNTYDTLLIELGEKSYIPEGSNWPVEVRLLGLVLINVAFFIFGKIVLKKTGSNLMGMLNAMNNKTPQTSSSVPVQKRRMKGPEISIDELPEVK